MLWKANAIGEGDGVLGVEDPDIMEAWLVVRRDPDDLEPSLRIEEEHDLATAWDRGRSFLRSRAR